LDRASVWPNFGSKTKPGEFIRVFENLLTSSQPHEVLVKVKYCSLNPVDVKWLFGDKLPYFLTFFLKYLLLGKVGGFDFSGEVVKGSASSGYKPGDHVFGTIPVRFGSGSFAEYISAPLNSIQRIPNGVSFEQSAAIPLVRCQPDSTGIST
jgi:NADPH2:quinone reductase